MHWPLMKEAKLLLQINLVMSTGTLHILERENGMCTFNTREISHPMEEQKEGEEAKMAPILGHVSMVTDMVSA